MSEIKEPGVLERLADNVVLLAGAIATLTAQLAVETTAAPAKKAGRPAKGEVDGKAVVVSAAEPVTTSEAQPAGVSSAVTPTSPTTTASTAIGTKEAMKAAVLAYRDATDQDTALKILTAVGAENFGTVNPALYQQVTDAAVAALAALKPAPKTSDPFGDDDEPVASTVVLADVKKAFVARQKDVSEAALLGVLKELGAVGPGAPGTPPAPSLKHLAADKFAAAIAAVNALPKTK